MLADSNHSPPAEARTNLGNIKGKWEKYRIKVKVTRSCYISTYRGKAIMLYRYLGK